MFRKYRLKICLSVMTAVLLFNFAVAVRPARAFLGVGDITTIAASIPDALSYLLNKVGTIFFQNLLRKYINDLAVDAAKYLAVGAKGQEKLYIEQKWGNFWANVGDRAMGDFIETFANSIISDIAADDIKKEGTAVCDRQEQECLDRGGGVVPCDAAYRECLSNRGDIVNLNACDDTFSVCQFSCEKAKEETRTECLNSCQRVRDACKQSATGATERARVAPMFKGSNSPLAKINICNPSLQVGLIISLGLSEQYTGYQSNLGGTCKWSEMKKNWTNEYRRLQDMASPDFLQKVSTQFYPNASDLSVALTLHSNLISYRNEQVVDEKLTVTANKGYLDVRNFAGDLLGTPGEAEQRKKLVDQKLWENLGLVTGDILVDAANIFLSQWAINSFTNLMSNLGSTGGGGSLSYWSAQQVGRQAIENRINKLAEPLFSAGGKIDILSQLTLCPEPESPGPTDCVIGNEFSTAIEGKMTVIEAVRSGRLPGNWPFGFDKNGEDKIAYNQGYPYRSMIILRKYRVLPVGWEVAAQEIQRRYQRANPEMLDKFPNGITLNDLLACYKTKDNIGTYYESWCAGLVDPNWVLKVPEYYCAREGFGPQFFQEPSLLPTGARFCSADEGETRTMVEGRLGACQTKDDCCSDAELATRDKLMVPGKEKQLRSFTCNADCSYNEQKLEVYRDNKYCADEQGCLKEGRNGSCLFRGYCAEEKRSWIFNKDKKDEACEPLFNTCQSFRAPSGRNVSYLANTLDYGCEQSAVGCKEYAYNGTYSANTDTVSWNSSQNIYLNRKTGTCASRQEGCHEFIRVKDNNGVNLLADGGLEGSDSLRWKDFGTVVKNSGTNKVYQGGASLKVADGQQVIYNTVNKSLLPAGFTFDLDRLYTMSAYVYVIKGQVEMVMGNSADQTNLQVISSTAVGEWQNLVLTVLNDNTIKTDYWAIRGTTPDTEFFVDNMKFEMGRGGQYSVYHSDNLLYEKLLPVYMESACYRDPAKDFNFKDGAPAKCSDFARQCQADEVGCELYTEANTKDQTAAQVKPKDVCPKECVGYDTFIQQANNFYSARDEYFIPRSAKTCRAQAVGCSQFVNLDKIKAGGEENEYFANFRRCVKPDEANSNCAEFYTWEGSNESGYQLVVYQLQANTDQTSGISQPATVDDTDTADNNDGETCNEDIYALPYDHPQYNADCRQFYGRDGNVSYHVMAKTIACSKECYPYRLVNNNIDVSITSQAACEAKQGHWDADKENCILCINGGVWMDEHQACVYQADPGKSQSCSASEVGCSEYEGDFGNQVRIIFNDTFEGGGLSGWGPTTQISSDSLTVGGHSLQIGTINNTQSGWFEKSVKGQLHLGKRYVLSFIAKKKQDNAEISQIFFKPVNGSNLPDLVFTDKVDLTPDWKQYKFDLQINTQAELDSAELLYIRTNGQSDAIRIDNLKLLETSDTHYLIRNSWKTPASCDQDLFGHPAPLYMLGCKQYSDRARATHYLKSFDKLCQDSAVGCELMIDTHNSSFWGKETFNAVTVPADNFAYIVYEKSKECRLADKGCSRLGQYDDLAEAHKDVYLLNNPDRYRDIMCTKDQVGCEAWGLEGGGEVYFKDPGLRTCEYRQSANGILGWYKIKANHCIGEPCPSDGDCGVGKYCANISGGQVCASKFSCASDGDCSAGAKCQLIDTDEPCRAEELDYNKTLGLGVREGKVQPLSLAVKNTTTGKTVGNAGLCPANQNGCTEYIDPESSFSYNLLTKSASAQLKPDTLYVLKNNVAGEATITCTGRRLYHLDKNNALVATTDSVTTVKQSEEFYVDGQGSSNLITCSVSPATAELKEAATAELKEAIVSYRLKDTLNSDKPNTVNPGKGQVLFNERSFTGGKYNSLVWDVNASQVNTDGSEQGPQPATDGNENNANALLKVDPDRQCSAWLGCKSYIENPNKPGDKICYERGLCDRMNDAGECIDFISKDPAVNQTNATVPDISGLTGYAKVGYVNNLLNADMYHLATMKQEGDAKVKFDGSFENAWETDFVDWENGTTRAQIINDARVIERELGFGGYKIIPDGRAVGKTNVFSVKEVNNAGNRDYVVSAYVFLRYGSKVELTVGRNLADSIKKRGGCPFEKVNGSTSNLCNGAGGTYAVVASTGVAGRWVRLTGSFSISNAYQRSDLGERDTRITIGIKPTAGLVYFDDVRLEVGLNYKDVAQIGSKVKQYLHSDCRLYPDRNSMSCDYFDDSGLRKKGWAGYCLEYDPRNPAACLLWYPIDKVESEEYEEGVALNIPKDLYYCVDADDGCNEFTKVEPEFQCKKFIKVDKEKYWYDRIVSGSGYEIPVELLTNVGIDPDTGVTATSSYFYADFGVTVGGRTKPIVLNQKAGSGYYGAYSSLKPPRDDKLSVGNVNKSVMNFVPYYGYSNAGLISQNIKDGKKVDPKGVNQYFCEATLDDKGHVQPIGVGTCLDDCSTGGGNCRDGTARGCQQRTLGTFDDCLVGILLQWNSSDEEENTHNDQRICNDYCQWDYLGRRCTNSGEPAAWWDHIKGARYEYFSNEKDGDYTDCEADLKNGEWVGYARDACAGFPGDGEEAGCLFDCYNHTKFYRVASDTRSADLSRQRAVQAVKRLFVSENKDNHCYVWRGKSYELGSPDECDLGVDFDIKDNYCAGKTRPDYSDSGADYCIVRPTVPGVKLEGVAVDDDGKYRLNGGGGWVTIKFASEVDRQQLPLRKYVINWGYQKNGAWVTLVRNVNMNARPSIQNGHVAYYFLDYTDISATGSGAVCDKGCCTINPTVTITDNWDAQNSGGVGNGNLDKSITICLNK